MSFVVVSKVKKHVKAEHDLRTSEEAVQALSAMVEKTLRMGAENARKDGRKTIAARDLEVPAATEASDNTVTHKDFVDSL